MLCTQFSIHPPKVSTNLAFWDPRARRNNSILSLLFGDAFEFTVDCVSVRFVWKDAGVHLTLPISSVYLRGVDNALRAPGSISMDFYLLKYNMFPYWFLRVKNKLFFWIENLSEKEQLSGGGQRLPLFKWKSWPFSLHFSVTLKTLKSVWPKNAQEKIDFFNWKKVIFSDLKKLPFLTKIFISKNILFFTLGNQKENILYYKTQKSIEILPGACGDWLLLFTVWFCHK